MDILDLIHHPERMDRDTLYELRSQVALYPYHQTLRLLMLQNLYLLHDPGFDEELRRGAIYVTDRRVLFNMVEAAHYQLPKRGAGDAVASSSTEQTAAADDAKASGSRTLSLIDNFLEAQTPVSPVSHPIDAAQDYIGYLLQQESRQGTQRQEALPMNGGGVVEDFLENEHGRIVLDDNLEDEHNESQSDDSNVYENDENNEILTEIMAGIYIKQGKYENAVKIIRQLSLKYPKKNRYFADQIRFLEKLIINNKHK
jgi:hypothetical protein